MKPLEYKFTKQDSGFLNVINAVIMILKSLLNGDYILSVKKQQKKASRDQFAWLYGDVYDQILAAWIDLGNNDITSVDELDYMLKIMFAGKKVINIRTGEILTIPRQKRNFTTIEMMCFVDEVLKFAQYDLNLFIEPPDSNWKQNLNFDK